MTITMGRSAWRVGAAVALLVLAGCCAATDGTPSPIVDIRDRTAHLLEEGEWIVEFYADWCHVCMRFAPTYDEVARWATTRPGNTLQFARVNVDHNVGLAARFFISAIPTLYYVKDGVARLYEKPVSLDAFQLFVHNEEWQDVQPWEGFLAPYSFLGRTIGSVLSFVSSLIEYAQYISAEYDIPMWAVTVVSFVAATLVSVAIAFVLSGIIWVFGSLFRSSSRPAAKTASARGKGAAAAAAGTAGPSATSTSVSSKAATPRKQAKKT